MAINSEKRVLEQNGMALQQNAKNALQNVIS